MSRLRPWALAILVALGAAGCGSAAPSTPAHGRSATTPRAAPPTTTATADTTSTSPSALPGAGKPPITIGDKNYTEQFVLGQLYAQALQGQGFTVNVNQNIGPTDVTLQALKTGALTLYPEYLNTFNSAIAGDGRAFRTPEAAYRAAQGYALSHGLSLLEPTPFSDTNAIAVTVAFAHDNRLRSLTDLRRVASAMAISGPPQFAQSPPGLPALSSAYGVTPAAFRAVPVGSQYDELNVGHVQAAYVNSTDGQLASGDYQLLADNRRIFGWGNVIPVVSAQALAQEGPLFATTIERVDRTLTTSAMRELNAAVDVAKLDPGVVATQFLETHGLLVPGAPAP